MFAQWPIRRQIFLLVAVLVVPLAGVLFYNVWETANLRQLESRQRVEELNAVAVAHVKQLTADADGILRTLASLPTVQRPTSASCEPIATNLISPDALFVDALIVRRDGSIVCHASGNRDMARVLDTSWFMEALEEPDLYISKPFRDDVTGRWSAMYVYRIATESDEVLGLFGLQVDLEALSAVFAKVGKADGLVVQVIDHDGIVIVRSHEPDTWIGRDVSDSALLHEPGEMIEVSGLEGTPRVFSVSELDSPQWTVYVGMSVHAISGPVLRHLYIGGVVTVLATGLAVLIGLLLTWRILRPVRGLVKAFGNGAETELAELANNSPPELSELAERYSTVVAAQQKAEQGEHLLAKVFESAQEAMMITDENLRMVAINRAFEEDTGFRADEAIGKNPSILRSGRHDDQFFRGLFESLEKTGRWSGEIWNRRKDGEIFPCYQTVTRITDEQGRVFYIGIMLDISQQKKLEHELEYLVHHDPLTRLPNRYLFIDRLRQAIAGNRVDGRNHVAILYIDVDRFKQINENVGHLAGDKLLVCVGERLRECLRESDTLARLGSDEFAILVPKLPSREALLPVIRNMFKEFARPFEVGAHHVTITISMGICLHPDDSKDSATLKRFAEVALHRAKTEGGNRYAFHTTELTEIANRRFSLENDLRDAVAKRNFTLVFEPQYGQDNELAGCEALIRWHHPKLGDVPPLEFIPIIEETGLINVVTEWLIEESCRQLAGLRARGVAMPRVSVNLSPVHLEESDFGPFIARTTARFGLAPSDMELEITEGALMVNPKNVSAVIRDLRSVGIRVAIDDFGTGYSSLSYLKTFTANVVKIDRSFITDVDSDKGSQEIVRAVVALGHAMEMDVLAEGVETRGEFDWLKAQGCDLFQGFLFSKPVAADQLRT